MYSFGFNGYIDFIEGLSASVETGKMNFADLYEDGGSSKKKHKKVNRFVKSYYAPLKNKNPVENNVKLDKNFIISGPNAAGKTTIIKSTLINIILSQQFGCGFYKSAKLKPYHHLHCYLNIPDTSGRDSLFQAEARRCKEILDIIKESKRETHFCVFDELYSGTNPDEAVVSAIAFFEYLVKSKNVTCVLTTHFTKICNNFEGHVEVINYHMDVTKDSNNRITYKYLLKDGISDVKGGINVLSDMNYPKEIIENSVKYGKSLQ
jgi:DNA mismatch repair ATPase MutS